MEPGGVNDLTTAREALLAELLGEVARLAEQLEAVGPALDTSREALVRSGECLAGQVEAFEARMVTVINSAQTVAVRHIAQRTDELARKTSAAQTLAMEEAARMLFRTELSPALQRVALPLQRLADSGSRAWMCWLTHAAAAAVAAAASWMLAALLWAH
jgi:hypothetical protein